MSSNQGRRKQEQTVPLIFERVRSRVTCEVSMPAKIAKDLNRYIEWACDKVSANRDEAMTLVMEQALGQFFGRDRLFQDELRAGETSAPKPPASVATRGAPTAQQSTARPAAAQ